MINFSLVIINRITPRSRKEVMNQKNFDTNLYCAKSTCEHMKYPQHYINNSFRARDMPHLMCYDELVHPYNTNQLHMFWSRLFLARLNSTRIDLLMDKSARLPSYFPSQPTPSYTHQPRPDEERLAITGENERARLPRGTFRVSSKSSRNAVTLELDNQEENASIPCFDKDAVIRGRIQLHNWERVQRVVVEVCIK